LNTKFPLRGNNSFDIGYVGSFYRGKGLEIIIELAINFPNIGFHIAGSPENELLHYNIYKYKNIYYYGHIPHNRTSSFRNSCDLLIAPYLEDVKIQSGNNIANFMSPIKIFEYMSSKKPMIVSDLSCLKTVINDSIAYSCSPHNIQEWVNTINEILENPIDSHIKAENAYNTFILKYTWEKRADNILKNIHI
jgi:glycosyltransferase involved in cell wall biosynthesis